MPIALQLLCTVAGLLCVGLWHGDHRGARSALLLWGSLCFAGSNLGAHPRAVSSSPRSAHEPSHAWALALRDVDR